MLIVQHRKGPLAGSEQRFESGVERITFGRDPAACDVVFPAGLTLVARRHFALVRKPSGAWVIEQFGDPYVGVTGQPAEPGQAVHSGEVIELGQPGGPAFAVVSSGKGLGEALPPTAVQYRATAPHLSARRARRVATVGLALALAAVGGVAGFFYFGHKKEAQLQQALAALAEQQRKVAEDNIGPAVRDTLVRAAYLVVKQFPTGQMAAAGTAFPVAADLLATNAHVADQFNDLKAGEKLFVRAPGQGGKAYQVTEVKLHPGYAAFNTFTSEDPLFVTSSRDCPRCIPVRLRGSLSYDVATMKVTAAEPLSPIVPIASRDELNKLAAGMAVGIAGYPTERIQGGEIQGLVATPNLRP
ncbi:MAG: FHA domain-containing protein, partial [Variibacter sp.]|nr:FHA domain-containing protein [Variibacter sp.]